MGYLVFARKYRPQTFADLLGQEAIVTTLTNAIRHRRVGHAYLFSGPRGTGKTSTARIFAKALNCTEGPTPTPCLSCKQCEEIAKGASLDILEIDGASNRGIDQVRALRELAKFTPAAGAFKVYIIDEVHQITAEGFNALLKTLEEPPGHVLFILATTAPHKVPATILSRCQRYDFKRLPLAVISRKLRAIAKEEKLKVSDEAVIAIARAASGSLRDAESILDQVVSFAEGEIRGEDVRALLGTIDEDTFSEALNGLQARDPVRLLRLVAEATNEGTDLIQWTLSFLSFLRNVLVAKIGAGPLGFEDLGPEAAKRLAELAQGLSIEELTLIAQGLTHAVETMRRVGEPRIPLEICLIRLSSAEPLESISTLLERLDKLSGGSASPTSSAPLPAERPAKSSTPPSISSAASAPGSATLEQVASVWQSFLHQIHEKKASTSAYLSEAYPVALEPGNPPQLVIGFPKGFEFHRDALDRHETRQLLHETLKGLLGMPLACAFKIIDNLPRRESLPEEAAGPVPPAPAQLEAAPKPDPSLLNSVIQLFEGRVLPGEG